MAKVLHLIWEGSDERSLPRSARRSCEYDAYVPDPLLGRSFTLDGAVAADVADAEAAIMRLNEDASALVDTEALGRMLLRAESVASSRIEGLEVGPRRLLKAQAARELGATSDDVTADEVLGNIDAMVYAVSAAAAGDPITVETLLQAHERLLAGTRLRAHAGRLREEQNWIGGSSHNPCSAEFVPPPHEYVRGLLKDLAAFCNDDMLPAVAQAAIAHAQFETVHPFADGNGRLGRALVHAILRRRGLAPRVLPPISLVLATRAADYVSGLEASRYVGSPDSAQARSGLNEWIAVFAAACVRAVDDARDFEQRAAEIEALWRERLGRVRRKSSADLLLRALPGAPIITVSSAAQLLDRSEVAVNSAVNQLASAGILSQLNVGRRNRAFEAREMIDAFAALERQLASPAGDTRVEPPARPVPARRTTR